MPSECPSYYWFNYNLAAELRLQLREHSFFSNPRTPPVLPGQRALLHVCAATTSLTSAATDASGRHDGAQHACEHLTRGLRASGAAAMAPAAKVAAASAAASAAKAAAAAAVKAAKAPASAVVPARVSASRLASVFGSLSGARVVHVPDLAKLSLLLESGRDAASGSGGRDSGGSSAHDRGELSSDRRLLGGSHASAAALAGSHASMLKLPMSRGALGGGLQEVSQLSTGFWCTACVTTRRGGVVHELNRSTVRELERFCRVEARGALGRPGARETCCGVSKADQRDPTRAPGHPRGCPVCAPSERRRWNESRLSWHVRQWLPLWADMQEPRNSTRELSWRCLHPLCTGSDPARFP